MRRIWIRISGCFCTGMSTNSERISKRKCRNFFNTSQNFYFLEHILEKALGDEFDSLGFRETAYKKEKELFRVGRAHGSGVSAADIILFDLERRKRKGSG